MAVKRKVKVVVNAGVTVEEAFNEFIQDKFAQGMTKPTLKNYQNGIEYFSQLALANQMETEVNEINKATILDWLGLLQEKQMRTTTINSYLRSVRVFLYWCMDDERKYLEQPFKINLVKGEEPMPKIFTDEEVKALLQKPVNIMDFVEWRNWAIVNWIMGTGNRAATICNVQIGDVDFAAKQIYLRHTKNKKVQILPLSASLAKVLKNYIKTYRNGEPDDAWLFCGIGNEKLRGDSLAHSFGKYCKERGVEHTNLHGLRHYFATFWIKNGGSGDKLQRALGHSTYTMTQRYITLVDKDLAEDYEAFNPLDNLNKPHNRKAVRMAI